MIDIVKLIKECEIAVGTHVSIEFNDSTDCTRMIRVSFNWCGDDGYHDLSRIYSHQMMSSDTDVTQFIIDDFERHTTGEAK